MLTGSYEVLADETLRHDYDERLQMIKSIHNPYKLSNIKKSFATYYDNIKSRLLLFISRLRKLQLREEWNDFNRYFKLKDFRRNTYLLYKKYLLAHSWKDRILISADYLWEMKFTLLLVPAIVLGAKYQLVKPQTNYYVDLF